MTETRPVGRPSDYTQELSDEICSRLAQGESMRSVTRDPEMPVMTTMFRWLRTKPEFKHQYETAKEESADVHADDMLDIADYQVSQPVMLDGVPVLDENGKVIMRVDSTAVQHAKLRIDTRKWAASKLKPKKYGEKIQTETTLTLVDLTDEELDRKLKELERLTNE